MSEPVHKMQCMEIWGGNEAASSALSTPGIDLWVHAEPFGEGESGGDIHYVSACAAGKIARIVVADVSGHGADVSELARALRGFMRKNINTPDQRKLTRQLNRAFHRTAKDGKFATALVVSYFAPTDELIMVNAGHPRPMLYRAGEGRWMVITEELRSEGKASGLPLGIIEPTEYAQQAVKLERGDMVVICTDSVTERRGEDGQLLGEEGLIDLLGGMDAGKPEELVEGLVARIKAMQNGEVVDDDLTVMLVHHNGGEAERQSIGEALTAMAKMMGLVKV